MDKSNVDNLDEVKLKKMLVNFDKKYIDNQKLRIKHAESPTKFSHSEIELFAALDEIQSIATQPELYHILIAKKTLSTLVSLLNHENTDISAKVISILQEFTDIDGPDDQNFVGKMIEALHAENIVGILVSNLSRFDENSKEESMAVTNSLSIMENFTDFNSDIVMNDIKPLIEWMLKNLKKNPSFNSIKLPISELLSILLTTNSENKMYFGNLGGIDILLQQVAFYRRVAPAIGEEHEFLEQTINCLCTAILDCEDNRESFFKEEGIDLVELILREKHPAVKKSNIKFCILKLFNYVVTTDKNKNQIVTQCCERFIEVLGLRVLFPIFHNPKVIVSEKMKRREYRQIIDEVEEHTAAILLAHLKYCQNSVYLQRLLVKFSESSFEKLNRLINLHEKYYQLVSQQEDDEFKKKPEDEEEEEEKLKSSSHFTLRTIDYIILLTCYLSDHFETYDPSSGETFTSRMSKILLQKPALKHQILLEARKHIEEIGGDSVEEENSLELLVKYFDRMVKEINKKT